MPPSNTTTSPARRARKEFPVNGFGLRSQDIVERAGRQSRAQEPPAVPAAGPWWRVDSLHRKRYNPMNGQLLGDRPDQSGAVPPDPGPARRADRLQGVAPVAG